jgi:hypothetical protein
MDMAKYSVIIKGNVFEAIEAANVHGFELIEAQQVVGSTVGKIECIDGIDMLNCWFCEGPRQPPYPMGSLLHWSTCYES